MDDEDKVLWGMFGCGSFLGCLTTVTVVAIVVAVLAVMSQCR